MTPEQLRARVLELETENKTLVSDLENFKKVAEEKTARVKSLEEHNQKLFLKATQGTKTKEEETEEFTSVLMGEYAKHLTEEQLEQLKEIEGEL